MAWVKLDTSDRCSKRRDVKKEVRFFSLFHFLYLYMPGVVLVHNKYLKRCLLSEKTNLLMKD